MPLTVTPTLTYRAPRLVTLDTQERRRSAWQRVQEAADGALAGFVLLWRGLFRDAKAGVSLSRLRAALDGPLVLDAYNEIVMAWHRTVEVPARTVLPQMATALVQDGADAMATTVARLTHQPMAVTMRIPEVEQWITQYTGTQIRDITTTTLRTVRTVLREGWQAGTRPPALARHLKGVLGLTPRQQRGVDALARQLTARGQTPAQVVRAVHEATVRALALRARQIAETETQALAHVGAQQAWVQAVRAGVIDGMQVRRYWRPLGSNVCPDCAAIPGMNPEGVGLESPFQTPKGDYVTPPLHPACKCSVETLMGHQSL